MIYTTISTEKLKYKVQAVSQCGIRESSEILLPVLEYAEPFADPRTAAGAVFYNFMYSIRHIEKLPSIFRKRETMDWREKLPRDPDRYGCLKQLATGGAKDLSDFATAGEAVTAVLEEGLVSSSVDSYGQAAWHYVGVLQALKNLSDGITGSIRPGNDREWMMGWLTKMNRVSAKPVLRSVFRNPDVFDDRMRECISDISIPGVDTTGVFASQGMWEAV